MSRTWAELLGDAEDGAREAEERTGFFSRLRDSLGKSRRALVAELGASFDPAQEDAWERLEVALIRADVGVPATAELVRRLEARGELGDLGEALAEEVEALFGEPPVLGARCRRPDCRPRRRRQRHGEDDDDRKARAQAVRARPLGARRRGRHLPRGGRGAARDLGGAGGRRVRRRLARRRPRRRRVRRGRGGPCPRPGRRHRRHRRPPAHAGEPDGRARQGAPRDRRHGSRGLRTRRCSSSTRRRGRTGSSRRGSSPRRPGVTGIALTKLDGSAKGGVAIAIAHELGIPVKLVGVGEGVDDLRPFDAHDYARALVVVAQLAGNRPRDCVPSPVRGSLRASSTTLGRGGKGGSSDMAVTVFARYPGLSPQVYDEVVATLDLDANPPIGAILHLVGEGAGRAPGRRDLADRAGLPGVPGPVPAGAADAGLPVRGRPSRSRRCTTSSRSRWRRSSGWARCRCPRRMQVRRSRSAAPRPDPPDGSWPPPSGIWKP